MAITYGGKLFTGVSFNQGSFVGDRGHFFIKGVQQCSYALSLTSRNRVWIPFDSVNKFTNAEKICTKCSAKVAGLIKQMEEGK